VSGPFIIASSNPPPPLQPAKASLDPVSLGIPFGVILRRPTALLTLLLPVVPLVLPFGNDYRDTSSSQSGPALLIAEALVQVGALQTLPRSPSSGSLDRHLVEDSFQFGAVVNVPWRDLERKRFPPPFGPQVDLGRQPSSAPSQRLCRPPDR
jgi:hypothetical protein